MKTSAKKLYYPCYLLLIFDNVEMNYLGAFTVSLIITIMLEIRVFLVCKNKMKRISTCYHWVSANRHTRKKLYFAQQILLTGCYLHFFKFFLNIINFRTFSRVASHTILKLYFVEYFIKRTRTQTRTFRKSVRRYLGKVDLIPKFTEWVKAPVLTNS